MRSRSRGSTHLGLLSDSLDRRLFTVLLTLFVIDVAGISYWGFTATPFSPIAGVQRAISLALQTVYLAANPAFVLSLIALRPVLFVAASFCLLSTMWSADPVHTIGSSIRLFAIIGMVTAAQARYGTGFVLWRMLMVMSGVVVVTALSIVAYPITLTPGGGEVGGSFRGLFDQKNGLAACIGSYIGLALAFLQTGSLTRRWRKITLVLLFVAVGLIIVSRSATGVVIVCMLFGVAGLFRLATRTTAHYTVAALALGTMIAVIVLVLISPDIVELLGRNATFSSRTVIWKFALHHIWPRQMLGWGYGAFPLAQLMKSDPGHWGGDSFVVQQLHSSYLTVFAGIGWVGIGLFAWFLLSLIATTVRRLHVEGLTLSSMAAVMVLIVYLLDGVTEGVGGLEPFFMLTVLLIATAPLRLTRALATPSARGFRHVRLPVPAPQRRVPLNMIRTGRDI
jgi:O-antigen ligase